MLYSMGKYVYIFLLHAMRIELESRASFHGQMGLSNNAISQNLTIFSIWLMKKMVIFGHIIIGIRDELAAYFSISSYDTNLKI